MTPAHLGSSRDWERKEDGGRGTEPGDMVEEGKTDKAAEETAKNATANKGEELESGSKCQDNGGGKLLRKNSIGRRQKKRKLE